jgi:uncharacterized membrane protein YhaH (DUF805 family)
MDWVDLFTGIRGRIGRQSFWFAMIPLIAIEVAAYFLLDRLGNAIVSLLIAYPQFAILAKRAHDRNVPTWVAGLFVLASAIVTLLDAFGYLGPEENPKALFYVLGIPLAFAALVLIADFGFRRGTVGPNAYGPDPLRL